MQLLFVVKLAAVMLVTADAFSLQKPWFCQDNECPDFNVTEFQGKEPWQYEIRSYGPTRWVAANCSQPGAKTCLLDTFLKLFRYIRGSNTQGVLLDMKVPVLTAMYADGNMTRMFYLGDPNVTAAPLPKDPSLTLLDLPEVEIYVRAWLTVNKGSSIRKSKAQTEALKTALGPNATYDTSVYYMASYQNPWHRGDRQHEVWLLKL